MASGTILLLLTPDERRLFMSPALEAEWNALGAPREERDPDGLDAEGWRAMLAEVRPEVVVAAWAAPALPRDFAALTDGRLRYLCCVTGSVRHLVGSEHLEAGLIVTNWGSAITRTVAEAGLLFILAANRRLNAWYPVMHERGGWRDDLPREDRSLFGRRVGIHGLGSVARALVALLRPFGVEISAFSAGVPAELFAEAGVREAPSLEALFAENDVVVEVEALTPESTGMVTEAHLRRIPEGGTFVNIGRGAVVDEAGLVAVAREGRIQIALDVYAREPLPADSPLRGLPNVLLLPHLAGPTPERHVDAGAWALANLRRYEAGEPLQARITPEVFRRSS